LNIISSDSSFFFLFSFPSDALDMLDPVARNPGE
jgi:hypothetical protein